jgi:hypothetical protein
MDRNIGAANRRIPPDVIPRGSAARDLEREASLTDHVPENQEQAEESGRDFD